MKIKALFFSILPLMILPSCDVQLGLKFQELETTTDSLTLVFLDEKEILSKIHKVHLNVGDSKETVTDADIFYEDDLHYERNGKTSKLTINKIFRRIQNFNPKKVYCISFRFFPNKYYDIFFSTDPESPEMKEQNSRSLKVLDHFLTYVY